MNTLTRMFPLPGAVRPARDHGASSPDSASSSWTAPDPVARLLHPWAAPRGRAVVLHAPAIWPSPDPVMRFDLPAPGVRRAATRVDPARPSHAVTDQRSAQKAPVDSSIDSLGIVAATEPNWPPPARADAVSVAGIQPDRNRISTRLIIGLAAAVGAFAAGSAALLALF